MFLVKKVIYIKFIFKLSVIVILVINFTGCSENNTLDNGKNNDNNEVATETKMESLNTEEIIKTLCSDEFSGRLVGSEGNEKAEKYIFNIYQSIGLEPLFEDSYYQTYTQKVLRQSKLDFDTNTNDNNVYEKQVNNLIGVIEGLDKSKAVVISAHLDHIGNEGNTIFRGALDDASGVATVINIAENLKKESIKKPFNTNIIIAIFNSEEFLSYGSKYFVNSIKEQYKDIYNINIDCVGGKEAGNISLNNKSKISDKLTQSIKDTFNICNMKFSNSYLTGINGDDKSFESAKIPNIYIGQEKIKEYVHKETDIPSTLNYSEIEKLANVICEFVKNNDNENFKENK